MCSTVLYSIYVLLNDVLYNNYIKVIKKYCTTVMYCVVIRGRLYGNIMATNVFNLNEFIQFECIQFEGIQFEKKHSI